VGIEPPARTLLDLHCHSAASYDSLAPAAGLVRVAIERGLTHVAITDHERIDGALRARDEAPLGITVIVGEEVHSRDGDLIGLFLERAVPAGLPALETIEAIHEQGGLVGIPHPFDRFRSSGLVGLTEPARAEVLAAVDYIEVFNGRVPYPAANERAAALALEHRLPGIAASDAHSLLEVGVAYTILDGPVESADDLRAALPSARLVTGRGSFLVRASMPFVKLVQYARGNRPRRTPGGPGPTR
jgi:predicted metal-dependent phosphoesterase TrpH